MLIFGLTGILGKLISINSYLLVWYRVLIAVMGISCYFLIIKTSIKVTKKQLISLLLVGVIIAAHWVTFFEAIKQSTVSVALVCLSSSTLFTSLLEPLYFKRKVYFYEIIFGVFIIIGLYCIFSFEITHSIGILLSIISALLASWFTVINGKMIKQVSSKVISYYELIGAVLVLSLFLIFSKGFNTNAWMMPTTDVKWILILGLVCTAFAFILSVEVMKKIPPFTVTMSVNLEPIYSILLAILIWPESEKMSSGFYLGASIVLITIFLNAIVKRRMKKKLFVR